MARTSDISKRTKLVSILLATRPFVTIATSYMVTDFVIDAGLVGLPYPFDLTIYVLRYATVASWSMIKLYRQRFSRRQHAGVQAKLERFFQRESVERRTSRSDLRFRKPLTNDIRPFTGPFACTSPPMICRYINFRSWRRQE